MNADLIAQLDSAIRFGSPVNADFLRKVKLALEAQSAAPAEELTPWPCRKCGRTKHLCGDGTCSALSASETTDAEDAARFRWWLALWTADSDEALDRLNDVVGIAGATPTQVRACIDSAMRADSDRGATR